MPTASITSAKTGQTFKVNFANDPTEEDIDEVTSVWETEFYQREGLDPSIAEQGVLGTAGNAFARDLGGTALDAVGGVAKGAAEMNRALGPAGNALRLVPGVSSMMSLGQVGDQVAGFTDAVREEGRAVYPVNPANPVAETIGGGAGQAVAMLGTMGAAAPVVGTGAALTVVPSVLGGTMGLGSGIDTAKDLGIDNPAGRLALGAAFGGAEALTERLGGIGGKAAAEALQQGVKAGLKQAGKSVLGEAIEEPISGTLQDAATYTAGQFVEDPNRPGYTVTGMKLPDLDAEFLKRRKMEAIGGAAGGAVFGSLQLAASGRDSETQRGGDLEGGTPPALPVSEDLGELTTEDIADLEPDGVGQPMSQTGQAVSEPARVPVPGFQDDPLNAPPLASGGNVLRDFGIAKSPNAQAVTDAAEVARQRQVASMQVQDGMTRKPMIPDSPLGGRDILDFLNDTPLSIPRKGGQDAGLAENDWRERYEVPMYYRKFIARSEGGYAPDVLAQNAFDAGLINEPSVDALMQEVQSTIQARTQYRVQFRQQAKALNTEAKQVSNFETDQAKAAARDKTLVALDDVAPGDEMMINGEKAVVRKINYDEDGYLTNVVIEDGKRFGVLSLDPTSRAGLFVDEYVPRARESTAADFAEEPFTMESVSAEELAAEKQRAAARAKVAAGQAKTLKGDAGEYGTADMLDSTAGDMALFNQAPVSTVGNARVPAADASAGLAGVSPAGRTGFKNLEPGGKSAGFVNGQILAEAETLIRDGFKDFANWSRAMVTRFGQAIRQYLQGIWEQVVAALPNDAAKNVRLGAKAKGGPVSLAQGGFVAGSGKVKETQARFARPEEQERLYQVREDVTVKAAAEAWVDSLPMAEAVAAMEAGRLPADMTGDVAQHAAGLLIQRTTEMMKSGSEVVQMQARSLGHRISKVWQGWLSQEAGRNLRQRSVVNSELTPYAPILAAEGMLIDRADAVMDQRFDGGATGGATKVNETADKAGGEASTELAADLESAEVKPGESEVARELREARKLRAMKKHPSLKRMLDALRKKMYPGMKWADIFMELPASQKERQREIYRRLMLDERLKGLTKEERLALTNELDKAWQQERRKVFLRELERVGIGEKAAADKAKVVKALPKLIRLINLGMMNSEMFREAIAPEYGLKQITTGQALALRKLAEEAYALPEGVLRSRKLAALLDGIQKSTGTGLPEVLNQYWVAAVLSGMRTQFDTFMSVSNGFGNQLIQSGMLALKNGNRAAATVSMMEWWRGLKQAFPEAMQILAKGDYSYLKRFNEDLKKALEGETTFRPVPLGEALWRDGNAMEKYGFAPVMIFTGRLMAAADHLNNSATTAGAKVVARALHPELYQTVAASQAERDAAAAQARREVTGGAMPATAQERATVAARTREILNGQLRPEELQEASFMGDQAAYQNDPTGAFGGIYRAVNQGLGSLERGLQAYADEKGADGPAGRYARGLMLFLSGAMRSMMGAKFIRFGANFGNDMLGFVPGTVLASRALLGKEATASQRQLLMGKNVFGLMAGLTVAAMFLGKDDEEEGWHMEGPWTDLTPEEIKQRRAAGFEPLTFWKRDGAKLRRVSYKQWPTAGLLAGVAHMQDRQRFRPEKWAQEGMAGHLLAAASVGAFQVKDVSAMRGLADLLGASKFGTNPEDALVEKLGKMPVNFAGGFIPTLVKDLDALADPRRYKPEGVLEEFLRNVPVLRQRVAGGRPELNILGVPIEQDRKPWSRAYTEAENGPAHAVLGSLSARGFTLPTPETNRKVWKAGAWTTIAALGADAEWRYQKKVGDAYRAWLGSPEGAALLTNPDGLAVQRLINRQAEVIKMRAVAEVVK